MSETWTPAPMQVYELDPFYAMTPWKELPKEQRSMHPLAAKIIMNAQDGLMEQANDDWPNDKPIIVYWCMMRDNAFQYRLVIKNRPRNVPTATVGSSLHAFGLAIDIHLRETMKRINEAGIDMSFQDFRQYLAGLGAIGIKSEDWHYNLMLREQYYDWPGYKLRDALYAQNWTDLSDDQKMHMLGLVGCTSTSLKERAIEFQQRYGQSLQVDGIPGKQTMRAAYVEWAHKNFQYVDPDYMYSD